MVFSANKEITEMEKDHPEMAEILFHHDEKGAEGMVRWIEMQSKSSRRLSTPETTKPTQSSQSSERGGVPTDTK